MCTFFVSCLSGLLISFPGPFLLVTWVDIVGWTNSVDEEEVEEKIYNYTLWVFVKID